MFDANLAENVATVQQCCADSFSVHKQAMAPVLPSLLNCINGQQVVIVVGIAGTLRRARATELCVCFYNPVMLCCKARQNLPKKPDQNTYAAECCGRPQEPRGDESELAGMLPHR
jgi:hypothetical protein